MAEVGKIIFLGNGLSTAPLEILNQRDPSDQPEMVLLDAIDYRLVQADLLRLKESFDNNLVEAPADLTECLDKCNAIVSAADEGRLSLVSHVVGEDELPEEAKNADVAVNVFGPPISTIDAQIDCLKPSGQLYTASPLRPPDNKNIQQIEKAERRLGYIVTKAG
jgi:hypothetical protein